jgi:hypothetical protein
MHEFRTKHVIKQTRYTLVIYGVKQGSLHKQVHETTGDAQTRWRTDDGVVVRYLIRRGEL